MTVPTYLTLLRILLIPIFIGFYCMPFNWGATLSATIFVIACITDWLDGYLARFLKQTSALGSFLDPVADKLLVALALVLLVSNTQLPYIAFPAMIIVGREIIISALREWMAELGKRTSVAVSYVGKVKTFLQMAAITNLLAYHPQAAKWLMVVGYLFLYVAAGLTVWSMVMYLRAAWPDLQDNI